jgi:hypothetical protein
LGNQKRQRLKQSQLANQYRAHKKNNQQKKSQSKNKKAIRKFKEFSMFNTNTAMLLKIKT